MHNFLPSVPFEQARICVNQWNSNEVNQRREMLFMYEHRFWMTFNYKSWGNFVDRELKCTREHSYVLIELARVEREIALPEDVMLPDSHLKELSVLVTGELMRKAYERAKSITSTKKYRGKGKMHEGKVTAKNIKEAVREIQGLPANPEPEDVYDDPIAPEIVYIENEIVYQLTLMIGNVKKVMRISPNELVNCPTINTTLQPKPRENSNV